jgi:lipoprotein-releasing system permease protein
VNDKKKEIAILRAMGATSWSISLIFGVTGAITGMMGTLIGFILATLTLHNFDTVIAILTRLQGFQPFNPLFFGNELPHALSSEALFFVVFSTLLLSIVSALIPAIKASRLQPAQILRAE